MKDFNEKRRFSSKDLASMGNTFKFDGLFKNKSNNVNLSVDKDCLTNNLQIYLNLAWSHILMVVYFLEECLILKTVWAHRESLGYK